MVKYEYKRIEESIKKEEINKYLTDLCDGGWRIINYGELPAATLKHIRVILTLEKEVIEIQEPKKKKRLFS